MSANLLIHKNAFRVHLDVDKVQVPPGKTIYAILSDNKLVSDVAGRLVRNRPFLVYINGRVLLQKYWNTCINDSDVIQIVHMPKGGGGGSNGIIMGVIAAVLAYFTFGMSLWASAAIGVAVAVGSTLLMPVVPNPKTSSLGNGRETSSPTYNLNAQGNSARLLEAMPRVYGTMRTYPDLAALSYSEYRGNQQWLYQIFCVSLGRVRIDKMLVDETDLTSFDDYEVQIVEPNQAVTLFPDNVIVVAAVNNIELLAPDHPDYTPPIPFVISSDTDINYIGVDISNPRGVGQVNDSGETISHAVQIQIDYRNLDGGAWVTWSSPSITNATNTPQVSSYKFEVPLGKYESRVYRLTGIGNNRVFDQCNWMTLRGYAPSTHVFGNCTLIAVAQRATNALNSNTARKFSVVSTSYLQKWNPVDGFTPEEPCNNIAWAASDVIRNEDYGRGLPTSRINIENLYRLDQIWESRGDKFNGVFDTTSQLWEALKVILMCGRATPMYYSGLIDFIRDEPQSIVTAQFSPATMIKGSFSLTYKFHDHETPDHVVIEYEDPVTFKPAEVPCFFPGSLKRNPSRVRIKGCTDREQAHNLGMSMIASNRDRRKTIEFSTLKPGLIPAYNGLIRVMHDVPQWGYGGRVLSFNRTTGQMRTTEPVPFEPATEYKVAFRKRNGSENGPYTIIQDPDLIGESNEFGFIVVATALEKASIYISDGVKEDYTHYTAGPSEQRGILALVQRCRPDSEGRVAISCINYAASVYTAENDANTPSPPPESNLPGLNDRPIIDSVTVVYTVVVGVQNIIASVTRNAIYYEFQARFGINDWQTLGTSNTPIFESNLSPGPWTVRVRGVGRIEGPWTSWMGVIEATTLPVPTLTSFVGTSKLFAIGLNWSYNAEMATITKAVEIRSGITNVFGDSQPLIKRPYPANSYTLDNLGPGERRYFWARCEDTAGRFGPWYNNGAAITQVSETDADKMLDYLTDQIGKQQLTAELIAEIESPDVDLGPVYAAIDEERILRENGDGALAQTISQTTAIANGAMAATQVNAQSIANTNGSLSAMYTIKTQLTVGGIPYIAGIGIGVSNESGVVTTTISMLADRFALINNNSGVLDSPFQVVGSATYLKQAFIQQATIVNLLIGATLQSVATDSQGRPLLSLNFQTGEEMVRSSGNGYRTERAAPYNRIFVDGMGPPLVEMGVLWTG